jgi:hypothetical protein
MGLDLPNWPILALFLLVFFPSFVAHPDGDSEPFLKSRNWPFDARYRGSDPSSTLGFGRFC